MIHRLESSDLQPLLLRGLLDRGKTLVLSGGTSAQRAVTGAVGSLFKNPAWRGLQSGFNLKRQSFLPLGERVAQQASEF